MVAEEKEYYLYRRGIKLVARRLKGDDTRWTAVMMTQDGTETR